MRPGATWLIGLVIGCNCMVASRAGVLDEHLAMQVGSFSSAAQAQQDARYDAVTWHIAEIWREGDPSERWLYAESWMPDAPAPYMQRISRLRAEDDGTISARRYVLPEYAEIRKLREGIAEFEVLVLPVPQLPK